MESLKISIPCYIPPGSAKEERNRKPVWVWRSEALGAKYQKDIFALSMSSASLDLDNVEDLIEKKDTYADEVVEKVCKLPNRESLSRTFTLFTLPSLGLKLQRILSKRPTRNQAYQILIDSVATLHSTKAVTESDISELRVLYDLWNPLEPIAQAIMETFEEHELANLELTSERWVSMPRRECLSEWRIIMPFLPLDMHSEIYSIALSWFEDYIYMCRMDKRARRRFRFLAKLKISQAEFQAHFGDKHHFIGSEFDSRSRSSSVDITHFHSYTASYAAEAQKFENLPEEFTLLTCLFDVINEFEELYEFEHAEKPLSRMWFPDCIKDADKKAMARIERQLKRQEDLERAREKERENKERGNDGRIIITKIEKKKKKSRATGDAYSTDGSTVSS